MNDQVHTITDVQQQMIPPQPKRITHELEKDADAAVLYLERFARNSQLDTDFRMGLGEIIGTIKALKQTVKTQAQVANDNHDKIVELTRAQRLI